MTSLLDIGPLTEEIKIGDAVITVRAVTPEGFFYLLAKYPILQSLFSGGSKNISMGALQAAAPTCVASVLAVTTTDRSEYDTLAAWAEAVEAATKKALNLSAHHQVAIFQAAVTLTFPDGLGPFMEAVEKLGNSLNRVSGSTAPATTSSKQSRSGFTSDSPGMRLGKGAPSASSRH